MNEKENHEMESLLERTLEETVPTLKPFLKKGYDVLDVGCGLGTITLDVARCVTPGQVVGIDHIEHRITKARTLAVEQSCDNVRFESGDANKLPFKDEAFDVVYSNTVLHYFLDPAKALNEQQRVLKTGGWLVAAGVRDWGFVKRYPDCPNWDALLEARIQFSDAIRDGEAHFRWERRWCLPYTAAGRKCPEWFSKLGMKDIQVEIEPYKLEHAGAVEMEPTAIDLLPWESSDPVDYYADYGKEYTSMIEQGFLDKETITLAMNEAKQWFYNPSAFHFYALIHIAGRK